MSDPAGDSRRQSCLDSLSRKIDNSMKRKESPQETFCCFSDIRRLWGQDQFADVFYDSLLSDAQRGAIRRQLLKFLSFVVYTEIAQPTWYSHCRDHLFSPPESANTIFSDGDLPLSRETLENLGFRRVEINWHYQHRFVPAVIDFSVTCDVQKIEPLVKLPFESRAARTESGGYGIVEFHRVSPECIENRVYNDDLWKPKGAYAVAVKSFHRSVDAKQEVENLCIVRKKLATINQNITLHHAILDWKEQFYIVLPLADLGNLNQLLRSKLAIGTSGYSIEEQSFDQRFPDLASDSVELAVAILTQCIAIAEALKSLHEGFHKDTSHVYLAHMDLKPDNILIFKEKDKMAGSWRLADFGISVIKEVSNTGHERRTMNTRARRGHSTYQAPEVQRSFERQDSAKIGRKSDIWSFGAIFAETLAFVEGGSPRVRELDETRSSGLFDTFYSSSPESRLNPHSPEFWVRPEVTNWLQQRRSQLTSHNSHVACWSSAVERILVVDPNERPDAKTLITIVEHVIEHAYAVHQGRHCRCDSEELAKQPSDPISSSYEDSALLPFSIGRTETVPLPSGVETSLPRRDLVLTPPRITNSPTVEPFRTPVTTLLRVGSLPSLPDTQVKLQTTRTTHILPDQAESLGGSSFDVVLMSPSNSQRASSLSQTDSTSSRSDASTQPHGIYSNPENGTSKLGQVSWRSPVKLPSAVSVAISQSWIAYLTKATIELFRILPESNESGSIEGPATILLSTNGKDEWKHIAVAGDILVVWGVSERTTKKDNSKSLLNVFRLDPTLRRHSQQGLQRRQEVSYFTDLDQFDYNKRVAVSSRGLIAVINGAKVLIINLDDSDDVTVPHLEADTTAAFEDIAFNEEGTLLYAWAVGQQVGCFCFDVSNGDSVSSCTGSYDWEWSQKMELARLYPFNRQKGCLIVPDAGETISAKFDHPVSLSRPVAIPRTPAVYPRSASPQLQAFDIKAACIYNNHSLVTIDQKWTGKAQINEYRIPYREHDTVGSQTRLCNLNQKLMKRGLQIRALRYELHRITLVIVCDLEGKMEIIKFGSESAMSRTLQSPGR